MRCFHALLAAGVALAITPAIALAQTVTHTYRGTVDSVYNLPDPRIQLGDEIIVTYVLSTETPVDEDPDPAWGFYESLEQLRIQIPSVGLDIVGSPDIVQTRNDYDAFDNGQLHDTVYFLSRQIAQPDTIQGTPIIRIAADFLGFPPSSTEPARLLTSDALPFYRLEDTRITALLYTADFNAVQIGFRATQAPEPPSVEEVVSSAVELLQQAVSSGRITRGTGQALSVRLRDVARLHASEEEARACAALTRFSRLVDALERTRLPETLAAELKAHGTLLGAALGNCSP